MTLCRECKSPIARDDRNKVQCATCLNFFHGPCTKLSASSLQTLKQRGADWACPSCKPRRSSVGGEPAFTALIGDLRRELTLRAEEMLETARETAKKMKEIGDTLEKLAKDSEDSKRRIAILEEKAVDTERLVRENEESKQQIRALEKRVMESERMANLDSIELHGIPDEVYDVSLAADILRKVLDWKIDRNWVQDCYKVQKKIAKRAPKSSAGASNKAGETTSDGASETAQTSENENVWIVRFPNNRIRRSILVEAKKKRREANGRWLQCTFGGQSPPVVFTVGIYERINSTTRALLREAKKVAKDKNWKFVWINEGRVLMKRTENERVFRINSVRGLNEIK